MEEKSKNQRDPNHSFKSMFYLFVYSFSFCHFALCVYVKIPVLTYDGCCVVVTEAPSPDAGCWPGP